VQLPHENDGSPGKVGPPLKIYNLSSVWWPLRATLKNICFWHFFEKETKKRFKN